MRTLDRKRYNAFVRSCMIRTKRCRAHRRWEWTRSLEVVSTRRGPWAKALRSLSGSPQKVLYIKYIRSVPFCAHRPTKRVVTSSAYVLI